MNPTPPGATSDIYAGDFFNSLNLNAPFPHTAGANVNAAFSNPNYPWAHIIYELLQDGSFATHFMKYEIAWIPQDNYDKLLELLTSLPDGSVDPTKWVYARERLENYYPQTEGVCGLTDSEVCTNSLQPNKAGKKDSKLHKYD